MTWFRVLSKKVLRADERVDKSKKEYSWCEMGFFTQWKGDVLSRVLCTGTPPDIRRGLARALATSPMMELKDPFAMLRPLLDQVIMCCDDSTWRLAKKVRAIEKVLPRAPV